MLKKLVRDMVDMKKDTNQTSGDGKMQCVRCKLRWIGLVDQTCGRKDSELHEVLVSLSNHKGTCGENNHQNK